VIGAARPCWWVPYVGTAANRKDAVVLGVDVENTEYMYERIGVALVAV